ncbi:ABC transporter ATP-binding protein [Arthrobacter sp. zg-Y769]|uniref:ABC transporter ATP-binding protein n=1 Tax=Arthrobacter sp. zg-Y769 TaxID=2894191 RepID=UPI002F3F84D4
MIVAEGLSFNYGDIRVIDGVDLRTHEGRVLGLIGPNGSGKTTLLRILYGSLAPAAGTVTVDGQPLARLKPREAARSLSVVTQESDTESTMTVGEMVLLGRGPHLGPFERTGDQDHTIATNSLAKVGILHLGPRNFARLSGGERKRVLIARALAQQGTHMLLDEPTNHLDIRYQHEVLSLLSGLGSSSIVVLHDLNLAARYCDYLLLLDHGRVAAYGTVDEVLDPLLLESVYGVRVRRLDLDAQIHLLFYPSEA